MSDTTHATDPAAKAVLTLDHVTVETPEGYDCGLTDVNLSLRPGDFCMVRLEWETTQVPLADLACGILEPDEGVVRFCGEDWCRMGFSQANRERGRIGRTFEGAGWVVNLDVDENILLSERHHTWRSEAAMTAEAEALAREFDLDGLPTSRPGQIRRPDLARAALVRAFLGSPKLLLLERPAAAAFPDVMPALIRQVQKACERGAAVIWMTNRPETWQYPGLEPTCRYAMSGTRLLPM